jgi:tRNA (cmo5U34)-methyltransferase
MRNAVFELGARFVKPATAIVDLGCSRGEALAPFVERFAGSNRLIGVEISPAMLAAARSRFAGAINDGVVEILARDLRNDYPTDRASVTLAVLTIQFTPINYRQRIVKSVFDNTIPGGVFIMVEKVLAASAGLDDVFVAKYHEMKASNGYTSEQIERKRLALEGVLVPATARWNEDLLRSAGFREVECFWRWMNFSGWIAIRE